MVSFIEQNAVIEPRNGPAYLEFGYLLTNLTVHVACQKVCIQSDKQYRPMQV